jgi:prepilin-type N-terminal cleavage/methylation domain-containing protein
MQTRESTGYTLIELLVVLAILALASAIVLPILLRDRVTDRPFQALVERARAYAAARGEIIYLRIEPTGTWRMEGGGSALETDSASGHIAAVAAVPLTLRVSPSGTCAFDVRSAAAASHIFALDALTCALRPLPAITSS